MGMDATPLAVRDFERVELLEDHAQGCLAILAIHSTRLGPAFGGVRRWAYSTIDEALADALRLAESMTLKCAISEIAGGGGKVVAIQAPETDREAVYRMIARRVKELGGDFCTGPDVGTEASDLEIMARETDYVARPEIFGNLAVPTALGVFAGIEAVAERLGSHGLAGIRVAVQGLGEVGYRVAERVAQAGGRLIVSDLRSDRTSRAAEQFGATVCSAEEIASVDCDILSPCALGRVIDGASLPRLRARAIAGSANNALATPEMGVELFERGILYAPDFVINAGALIYGAELHLTGSEPSEDRVRDIGSRVGDLLDRARSDGVPPEVLAERVARERVEEGPRV